MQVNILEASPTEPAKPSVVAPLSQMLRPTLQRSGIGLAKESRLAMQIGVSQAWSGTVNYGTKACIQLTAYISEAGKLVNHATASDCRTGFYDEGEGSTSQFFGTLQELALVQALSKLTAELNRARTPPPATAIESGGNLVVQNSPSSALPFQGANGTNPTGETQVFPSATRETRTALVIGNSNYAEGRLKNPTNDARLMANTLRELGFAVDLLLDVDQVGIKRGIDAFGARLRPGGVALFYYAGHGVQVKGRNYLIPVRARIERESEIDIEGIDIERVLSKMDANRSSVNLVVLDACRNNPFTRSFRSIERGLAVVEAPQGTLIAFATAPGKEAQDGATAHSPYTGALAAEMIRPGVPVEEMFKAVRRRVHTETRDTQTPWEVSSLTSEFRFVANSTKAALTAEGASKVHNSGDHPTSDGPRPTGKAPQRVTTPNPSEDDIE